VPCKQVGAGCNTNGEGAIAYHSRVFANEENSEFRNRILKPSVRAKYKYESVESRAGAFQTPATEGPVTNKKLKAEVQGLAQEVKSLRLDVQGMRGDMRLMMGEVRQAIRRDGNTTVPPIDEHAAFPPPPTTDPACGNHSIQPTTTPHGQESAYSATDNWTQEPALATLMGETAWATPNSSYAHTYPISRTETPTPNDPHTHAYDPLHFQGDVEQGFIDGSGLNVCETREKWESHYIGFMDQGSMGSN
jgi:hypothetical protein